MKVNIKTRDLQPKPAENRNLLLFLNPTVHTKNTNNGDSEQSELLKFVPCPFYVEGMSVYKFCLARLDRQRLK